MSLEIIKNALLELTDFVFHYRAPQNQPLPYIEWMEDGANDFLADNRHEETVYQGTIDLYTLDEEESLIKKIPEKLNETGAAWYLNSVQFEEDTGIIHYEWVFEV